MSFHNDIISHLVKYKGETLHVEKDGIFTYRGKGIPKAHILPTNYRNLNILPEYRNQFFKSEYANIKFHRYFHHLNSSQAMCINLFYPLVNEEKLDLILDFLKLNCLEQPVPHFEKESELEQASRRTNFDFYLKCSSAINRRTEIFFEIKYTENGFGKAKPDEKHKKKFNETYLPLVKNSVFLTDSCKEESIFLDHYQLLRNFVHATLSSYSNSKYGSHIFVAGL